MPEFLTPYSGSILALGLFGCLYLLQLAAADLTAILNKHVPGTSVSGGHDDFLFRATRAHANTTESVGAAILLSGFAILRGADPQWTNATLWIFLAARTAHTAAYYSDVRLARSAAFGVALTALFVLFGLGLSAS